jgi:phosphatidylinositol alpha-1,6-mannosyltransferase
MQPRRVLLIANNFSPVRGGSAVVYANLARCARDQLIVLAPRISYADSLPIIGWREHDRAKPYRVVRLPLLRTSMNDTPHRGIRKLLFWGKDFGIRLRLAFVVCWLVAAKRVRAVCVGELLASSWIIQFVRLLPGVRSVVYVHGEELTTQDFYDRGHRRAQRALLGSDRIIVVSRFTQQVVTRLIGEDPKNRVRLIENGVDGECFRPQTKSQDLLDLYRLNNGFVYVSVCRLLEKKGVDRAIQAFAQVARLYPESHYLIVGTGPYANTLQTLAAQLALTDQVIFAGQVADDELAEHYRLGDVFVMPNRKLANGDTEGFGLVFLEANSCGLPVIAGRDGGSTDAVVDGVNGLVVDGNSVDDTAAAMLKLHKDADLRNTLRRHGLAVAARAGWADKTRAFLSICLDKPCASSGMTDCSSRN